jgi:hypothetical protein
VGDTLFDAPEPANVPIGEYPRPAVPARARLEDPDTSHAAAASITEAQLRESQAAVLRALNLYGPSTDEVLVEVYGRLHATMPHLYPRQSPSGIRSRRAELERLHLVENTGDRARISTGRFAAVWRVTAEGRERAA